MYLVPRLTQFQTVWYIEGIRTMRGIAVLEFKKSISRDAILYFTYSLSLKGKK